MSLIAIRFIKNDPPYTPGDIAGFELADARARVNAKKAVWVGEPPAEAAPAASEPASPDASGAPTATGSVELAGDAEPTSDPTPLPDDFPCRKVLVAAGIETMGAVPRTLDELMAIQGIGHGFAKKILAALES